MPVSDRRSVLASGTVACASSVCSYLRSQARANERQADQNQKLALQVTELKANQEHQRVAFDRVSRLLSALAARASDGKLAAAFLRNQISPILLGAQLFRDLKPPDRRIEQAVERIERQARHQATLGYQD